MISAVISSPPRRKMRDGFLRRSLSFAALRTAEDDVGVGRRNVIFWDWFVLDIREIRYEGIFRSDSFFGGSGSVYTYVNTL